MRRTLLTLLCLVMALSVRAAQEEERLPVEQLLERLDDAIVHKSEYQTRRAAHADSLREVALTSTGGNRIEALSQMFDTYLHFQTDSALSVLAWLQRLPEYATDPKLRTCLQIDEARIYGMMGFYECAFTMLHEVDLTTCDDDTRLRYLNAQHSILGWRAEVADGLLPSLARELHESAAVYHDSLLMLEPEAVNRSIIHSNRLYDAGRYQECLDTLLTMSRRCSTEQRIFTYSNLSQTYGKLGESTLQLRYLILTALSDIRAGITEYMALPQLAEELYNGGDATRAYNYLFCALEDANLCKSSLRTIEVSTIFPIIDQSRHERMEHDRRDHLLAIAGLCLLALLLVAALVYVTAMNRKLYSMRQLLADANQRLQGVNAQLLETNKELVLANTNKEQLLMSSLKRSRNYLASLEQVQLQLLKMVQARQIDELSKRLKETAFLEEEQDKFYADFDSAFLSLYPNFIERLNALLRPDAAILPRKGELLTTELRIFALIRMGETDSAKIANFLNYSLTTIYNYRSRVRNNALDKEQFEERVRKL